MADLSSVRSFAEETGRVDVLINNAGIMAVPLARTADGFESQLGTNGAPLLDVAHGEHDVCPEGRQDPGGLQPDAAAGTGDQEPAPLLSRDRRPAVPAVRTQHQCSSRRLSAARSLVVARRTASSITGAVTGGGTRMTLRNSGTPTGFARESSLMSSARSI